MCRVKVVEILEISIMPVGPGMGELGVPGPRPPGTAGELPDGVVGPPFKGLDGFEGLHRCRARCVLLTATVSGC